MYKQKRIVYCETVEEFNKQLDFVRECRNVVYALKAPNCAFEDNAFLVDKEVQIELSYKLGNKSYTYVFKKDTNDFIQKTSGSIAYSVLRKYVDITEYTGTCQGTSSGILYKNKKYEGKRVKAYGYDVNSAFSYGMLQPMPLVETERRYDYVKQGEIGFTGDENGYMQLRKPGQFAVYVFKAEINEGFHRFVNKWYKMKKTAKNKADKQKAKQILNFSIGALQHHNLFIRAAIIGYANERIAKLIDEHTIYSNTDSIVSTVRRPDIEANIGDEIGQWKLEHEGLFAFKKFNYQWNLDTPSYRGVPKSWFKEGFDILVDDVPSYGNVYELDKANLKLVEVDYGKAQE